MNDNPQTARTPRQLPLPPGQRQPQTARTPRQLPLLPGQRQPQPVQPDHSAFWAVAQDAQQADFQAPPAPAYNQQPAVLQTSRRPPPEQSALNANGDYSSQWHGHQQHQYLVLPPVAQPLPQLVAQPRYHSYQHTAGYVQHCIPQTVASPRLQLAYSPHPPEQHFYHTLPSQPPQPQYLPLPPPGQNTGVYADQNQGSGHGDGRDTRGGSMSGNRCEIADMGQGGSHMDSGGGFSGAATIQAEGRNTIPTSAEPAVVPVATQLQGAQNVNVSGNPTLMNIGTNTGNLTTVNNYGGTHGLEKLEGFVSFAALHNSAEQDRSRRCHPRTRENVLKRLRHWSDNPNPSDRIFWLHGPAGAGKSAIAQTIAHAYKRGEVAATFFFYRSDPNRNDGNRLFTTIAWQLAFSIPAVKDSIVQALHKLPHIPRTDVETQFEALVANPTKNIASQMPQPAPVVIIDGVDECSDEQLQRRFLTVIGDAIKDPCVPLRFLIASRPEALIEETLHKFKDFTVSIDLAKLDDSNRDIRKYLKDKFSEIASNRGLHPTWPGQEIIEEIVFKSSGNFIFPSIVIRFISDEDYTPTFLLNIVRNLTARGNMSPFAILDELFLEILKRQRDQDFLKAFLALLVARSFIELSVNNLHEDDTTLMNVSKKDLHIKLRRMRSLLKFEPFIDVYHRSFLDFLQDPSRSSQYHVSKQGGLKRYLELIVDSVVRHVSMVIAQPNCHGACRSSPIFKQILTCQPAKIVLLVEDWQEALKPLLDLQDKLLNMSKPQSCRVTQVMRDLLLHLVLLQGKSYITAAQAPESNTKEIVTQRSRAVATKNKPKNDLDNYLSVLLSCLQKMDSISVMVVDRAIIDYMSSVLAFDRAEIVARVRSASDAQNLIDLVDLLTNNECFLIQCGRDAACKAARLASEIFARVPLLQQSLFLNKPSRDIRHLTSNILEIECQSAFISRILDHNYIVPVLGTHRGRLVRGNENEQNERVHEWLRRSSPNLITRIRVILEIARTIQYIHAMDVVLQSASIELEYFFLDSNLRAKFEFTGLFAWWVTEASIYGHEFVYLTNYTYESNISAFANIFYEACFHRHNENLSNHLVNDAMQLIERCWTKDPKNWPTMKDVVEEMETWDLT